MLALIPHTFGNRRADLFGNTHVLVTPEGLPVFRHPGRYRGQHRRPEMALPMLLLLTWLRR